LGLTDSGRLSFRGFLLGKESSSARKNFEGCLFGVDSIVGEKRPLSPHIVYRSFGGLVRGPRVAPFQH
jgi:hypothetical protein